ncbi:unnamed protein product, partial [Closterium sp. NIES-53]
METWSEKLSPFIARHGPSGVRRVEAEWVDSDGRPTSHCYILHDSPLEGYPIAGTYDRCVDLCTAMAESLVHHLDGRLGSLAWLSGVKLFMPDEWPHGRQERTMVCTEHLESLTTLFRAHESDEIQVRVNEQKTFKELRSFFQVLVGAPKSERKFYPGLSAMLKSPDWEDAYPNLVKMWVAVAVLPLSTIECERGFSRQNVIKSWLRCAIKDARLSDLMCMALLSYEPDWEEVVRMWRAYKKRRPFTIVAASKKQPSAKGKDKVEEDGAGFVWGTETPTQMSMSDAPSDDDDISFILVRYFDMVSEQ